MPSRCEYFRDCVEDSADRIGETCPDAIRGVEIGIEAVPSAAAMWQGMVDHDSIPLAGAVNAAAGQPARLVLYERPLERRALDKEDLADLVHHAMVEQLASLTGRSTIEIDPHFEDDW
jgi:predicted Zn-dependent protease with MMP-like domain